MDIVSKRSGPRREDQAARRLIDQNRSTIERLADQLSNGAYSARKKPAQSPQPQASGLITSDLGSVRRSEVSRPYVRISPNRRVVVVDDVTSRQMHYLGELRRIDGRLTFVLATRANGFFSAFDREHAVDGAQSHLRDAGVAGRVAVTSGDFFEALPRPVDVVLLKSVLHDWNDGDAARILRRAREALAPEGRVLVIERVMPDRVEDLPEHRTTARSDLNMLVGLGGCERTAPDYDALLSSAGLSRRRTLPAAAAFSVIEAVAIPSGAAAACNS